MAGPHARTIQSESLGTETRLFFFFFNFIFEFIASDLSDLKLNADLRSTLYAPDVVVPTADFKDTHSHPSILVFKLLG